MARRRRMRTWRAYSRKKRPASAAVGSSTADDPVGDFVHDPVDNSVDDLEDPIDDPVDAFLDDFLDEPVVDPIHTPTARPESGSSVAQFVSRLDNYIPFTQDVVQFVLLSLAFG
jgi:hypothetical protein